MHAASHHGASTSLAIAMHAAVIRNARVGQSGKSRRRCVMLCMPHYRKYADRDSERDRRGDILINEQGDEFSVTEYAAVRNHARKHGMLICVLITLSIPRNGAMGHMLVMIDDARGGVTVFDNLGAFSSGNGAVQPSLLRRLREMTKRRTGFVPFRVLPVTCPRLNASRSYCAFWSALFLEYVLRRPSKTIADFARHATTHEAGGAEAYVDRQVPRLVRLACGMTPILERLRLPPPEECQDIVAQMDRLAL